MEERETLLIAEQGSELSVALGPWLSEYGHTMKAVDNFQDVLMTIQSEKISTLVMDTCLLPRTSANEVGCEAIALIKGLHRNLPIIVTTDENNPKQEGRIRQKGIFYYHVKSFGMDELMLAISNALARSCR
jgi:DNA-binding NtrC family response regulator